MQATVHEIYDPVQDRSGMILLVAVEEMQKDELRTAVWKVRNLDELPAPGAKQSGQDSDQG
jgi:hypothetical protein